MKELKPCTCGSSKIVADSTDNFDDIEWWTRYVICCLNCFFTTDWHDTLKQAIAAWNRRHNDGETNNGN